MAGEWTMTMTTSAPSGARLGLAGMALILAFLFPFARARAQGIHEVAAAGDTVAVAALLDGDVGLMEARDDRGRTPLQAAVLARQVEVARMLLERGADPNARDEASGQTAVDYAFLVECQRGGTAMTRLLLSRGAAFDPDAAVRGPVKRLDVAVVFGNLDMVRLLLDAGADPNAPTGYPMKPLASAASRGHAELVRVLLAAGADPDEPDARGRSPLRLAVEKGHEEVVERLLEGRASPADMDATTGQSLLHVAALGGNLPVVERLLAAGADVHAADRAGREPLYYALRYGHRTVAERLVSAGADPVDPAARPTPSASLLHRPVGEGEGVLWYLANRGWAVRTAKRLLVFDAEEFGVTRPAQPSLSNGFLTPAEVGDMDVVAFFTAYHGEPGEPAYIHQIEDSLKSVKYVQNAGDRWRGSARSVYLSPGADTVVAGARARTVEVTREMTSLGYLVDVDGLVLYYAGFRAEDPEAFAREVEALASRTERVDVAFLPIPEQGEDPADFRLVLERLHPRYVALLDPDRRKDLFPEVAARVAEWGLETQVLSAEHAGDAFEVKR